MAAVIDKKRHTDAKNGDETGALLKTRICIKNVDTRNIGSSQKLREQLLRQIKDLKITDALVLPDRRLAWVGLETAEMAQKCISFLNQTYALGGTHKVTVEYASKKSTATKNNVRAAKSKSRVPEIVAKQEDSSSLKRKQRSKPDEGASKKRPKQSFWANDEIGIPSTDTQTTTTNDETVHAPSSDKDFLRSKQMPVADLEEENEQETGEIALDKRPPTRRLFVRNLPFTATESQVLDHFSEYGATTVKIIVDSVTEQSKGYGFVECSTIESAQSALENLDGSEFQGRVLSVIFAEPPRENSITDSTTMTKFASQMDRGQGLTANHVRSDAVLDAVANALGVGQGDVLSVKGNLSAGDAAVRLALGETAVIQENRNYLSSHGYELDDFIQLVQPAKNKHAEKVNAEATVQRSKTALLVKNLPFDTTVEDLLAVFTNSGSILLTPSHTLAVVHFADAMLAKNALRRNAYRRFKKSVPLFLEWAPEKRHKPLEEDTAAQIETKEQVEESITGDTGTLYVKNLNFKTTETQLLQAFEVCGARSVRIRQKTSTTGQQQSLGYGFIEFPSTKQAALALEKLQGMLLDDHKLELAPRKQQGQTKTSNASNSAAKTSKLMVRNVPFQANRKELLQLFGQFGTLKRVRLPKKFDASQHRGFGFVEYVSHKEATAAKTALSNTHLYGRHLVIEYAHDEEDAAK